MTEVQLFKNCKIDNINRVSSFTTLAQQNAYYNGLITAGNGKKLEAINYRRLGDPLKINSDYDDLFTFPYGRIKLKDIWYYFSVTDIHYIQDEVTQIVYRFDPWETARLQLNTKIGRGYVERGKITAGNIGKWLPQRELQPRTMVITTEHLGWTPGTGVDLDYDGHPDGGDDANVYPGLSLIAVVHNSSTNKDIINYVSQTNFGITDRMWLLRMWSPFEILSKNPDNGTNFEPGDIKGMWVIPFTYANSTYNTNFGLMFKGDHYKEMKFGTGYIPIPGSRFKIFSVDPLNKFSPFDFDGDTTSMVVNKKAVTEDTKRTYITDLRGNEIFSVPYGREMKGRIKGTLDITYTSCKYVLNVGENYNDLTFTVPCEPVSVIGDAEAEYFARQRQTDIEGRRIAMNQQLAHGLASAATSAATGAVLGGIGGTMGAGAGAGVAGGGSIIESLIGYGIDRHYGHQQQSMLDNHYKHAKDELSLYGESINSLRTMSYVTEEWDDYSKTRYNNYIEVNGYEVGHHLPDCSTFYVAGGTLKGDFDIDGDIPEKWKQEIRTRFGTGVRIIV